MAFYCLQCGANCGEYNHCCRCEDDPAMEGKPHPGCVSDAEIAAEIQAEEFWEDYTS